MIYFALNDTMTGKEITSSELLFDPKFLEKYTIDETSMLSVILALNKLDVSRAKKGYIWVLWLITLGNNRNNIVFKSSKFIKPNNDEDIQYYHRTFEVKFYLSQFLWPEWYYNATSKLISLDWDYQDCWEKIYLDKLYYYDIERIDDMDNEFRILMMNIKSFQRKADMRDMINNAFGNKMSNISSFIDRKSIDCICVVPNNVERKISFNQEMQVFLQETFESLPFLQIQVHDFEGRKPQKATRWLCERIKNADQLFTIDPLKNGIIPKRILLIDDVFGSGATMNMIAKKIKVLYPDVEILWFAILGSYRKGFDVINEI